MIVKNETTILHDVKMKYDMTNGMCIEVTKYSRPLSQDPTIIIIQEKICSSFNSDLSRYLNSIT